MGDNYIPPYLLIFLYNADVRFSTGFSFFSPFSPLFFFFFPFFPGVSVKEEQSTSLRLFQPKINSEKKKMVQTGQWHGKLRKSLVTQAVSAKFPLIPAPEGRVGNGAPTLSIHRQFKALPVQKMGKKKNQKNPPQNCQLNFHSAPAINKDFPETIPAPPLPPTGKAVSPSLGKPKPQQGVLRQIHTPGASQGEI